MTMKIKLLIFMILIKILLSSFAVTKSNNKHFLVNIFNTNAI